MNEFVRIEQVGGQDVAVFHSSGLGTELRATEYVCRMASDFERGRGRSSAEYDRALRALKVARKDFSDYPLDHPGWARVAEAARAQ